MAEGRLWPGCFVSMAFRKVPHKEKHLVRSPSQERTLGRLPTIFSYTQTVSHGGDTKTKTTLQLQIREICLLHCGILGCLDFLTHFQCGQLVYQDTSYKETTESVWARYKTVQKILQLGAMCFLSEGSKWPQLRFFSFSKEEHQRTFSQLLDSTGKWIAYC